MTDYTELRRLAQAATPGPWSFQRHTGNVDGTHSASDDWTVYGQGEETAIICTEGGNPSLADPEYIAAASPDVVLGLLDEIDRLRADRNAVLEEAAAALDAEARICEGHHDPIAAGIIDSCAYIVRGLKERK